MKKTFIMLILLTFSIATAQKKGKKYTFGKIVQSELSMKTYEKDTTANAVVLSEYGDVSVKNENSQIFLRTTVYKKIKILNNEGKEHATVQIYLYNDKQSREKVKHLKAVTHNSGEPDHNLSPKRVYTKKINDHWSEMTFTFPNVKAGSVLEYTYDLESKFFFTFQGWTFQSDIPKIYSEFHASIPGNWHYNRHLIGSLKLEKNIAEIKKDCFSIGSGTTANCEELTYAMKDIPAFIVEDEFTNSPKNYRSRIKFELAEIFYTDGSIKRFTKTWKDTDKRLKYNKSIGKSANNDKFFAKVLPPELLKTENDLEKAKKIFNHIRDHYTFNSQKKGIFDQIDVKKAYKEKLGNVSEINLGLINALQAADLDAKIFLSSTRDNGFPTKLHPVMTDFNYLMAFLTIDGKDYLLDASDKTLPFNMIAYDALNSFGRVMDFENGSYWYDIVPKISTFERIKAILNMDEEGLLKGKVQQSSRGYFAKSKRDRYHSKGQQEYLNILSGDEGFELNDYENQNLDNVEKDFTEEYNVELKAADIVGNQIYLNPFISRYKNNPFTLNQRNYPVDFGYTFTETYMAEIAIPESLKIKSIPEKVAFSLPGKKGSFIASVVNHDHKIIIYTKIRLLKTIYAPKDYEYLKGLFSEIIKFQNSFIILEKNN